MNFRKITKVLSCLVLAVVALTLVGCKKTEGVGVYTYNTYTAVSPSNWNELTYQDSNDTQIMSYIGSSFFSYDFKFDANGAIVPGEFVMKYDAATKLEDVSAQYAGEDKGWNIPEGAKARAYKITLRNDLKWNDGTPIKAEDFVYTMKEQLNPLFRNYRADSFYLGATIIAGAKNYAKQGQSGWFSAAEAYSEYTTELDSKLEFSLGSTVAKDQILTTTKDAEGNDVPVYGDGAKAKSYIRSWLESQLGTSVFTAAQAASVLTSNFFKDLDPAKIVALEGKTFAQIKADAELKATWDILIGWWQTEPNEELHFFAAEYTYPAVEFDTVGIFAGDGDGQDDELEIILVLEKSLPLLKEDGSLSYQAAYNMSSLPLVKKDLYEQCKVAPTTEGGLWTSTYNSSVETSASWGPYELSSFQAGKSYRLTKNNDWYGYNLAENEGLYQTTDIFCETIAEWNTAWLKFLAGEIDGIGIDVSVADDYKGSDRAYFTPDDYVASLQLQSNEEQLKARQEEGKNKTILTYVDFRKALSLAINRAEFAAKTTTSSKAGFGLFNSMHYYDVENGGVFRNSDEAKQVLCDIYGVNVEDFESLDEAVDSITGYDLTQARQLVESAYQQALANGDISETDVVELTFGTSAISEVLTRRHDYVKNAWIELVKGTSLEGRLQFSADAEFGSKWADDFRDGKYDVCMGGWSGAAWDPGYFLLAYLSPDYMYSLGWDTSAAEMTFTMKGVGENGTDITDTMSLLDWYDCLNGATGAKYDFSATALEQSQRLQLIAALEKEVLSVYYSVPVFNSFSASLISYKVDYVTYEYNTFMGYGGMKYMTYNFDDADWAKEVAKYNNELNYK